MNSGVNGTLRANVIGEPVSPPNPSIAEWFNTAAFVAPPPGQYGDARRNSIIGPGEVVFDMALTKVFPLKESRMFEVRMSATNVFNNPVYTSIDTVVNAPAATPTNRNRTPDNHANADVKNAVRLLSNVSFFKGDVKAYETSLTEVQEISVPNRHAAVFQLDVPLSELKPGFYTCQVNVIDDAAGRFVFPRVAMLLRQ